MKNKVTIPEWIRPENEYSLTELVNKNAIPWVKTYYGYKKLVDTDTLKHTTIQKVDDENKPISGSVRIRVKGWSIIEYIQKHQERYYADGSQVINITLNNQTHGQPTTNG